MCDVSLGSKVCRIWWWKYNYYLPLFRGLGNYYFFSPAVYCSLFSFMEVFFGDDEGQTLVAYIISVEMEQNVKLYSHVLASFSSFFCLWARHKFHAWNFISYNTLIIMCFMQCIFVLCICKPSVPCSLVTDIQLDLLF